MTENEALIEETKKNAIYYRKVFWWQWLILIILGIVRFILVSITHFTHPLSELGPLSSLELKNAYAQRGGALISSPFVEIFLPYLMAISVSRLSGKSRPIFLSTLWVIAALILITSIYTIDPKVR